MNMSLKACTPYLISLVMIGTMILSGCTQYNHEIEVHEWGVFLRDYQNESIQSLTDSPVGILVKKPVIYLYGEENRPVSITVGKIVPQKIIPDGVVENGNITWNVIVKNDEIIAPNGMAYPYLFYEGKVRSNPIISANVTYIDGLPEISIKNLENFTLQDVIFVYLEYGDYFTARDDTVSIVYFDEIKPGEVVSSMYGMYINRETAIAKIHDRCAEMGLKENEINDLLAHWNDYWFSPSNYGTYTRIIFFVPQFVYDGLIPLHVYPEPRTVHRVAIFTVTNIPVIGRPPLENLTLSVNLDEQNLTLNETVEVTVILKNNGNETINLTFPTSQEADFSILDSNGNEIYRWSDGKFFLQVITHISIKPGEEITPISDTWKPEKRGNYTIYAWLETTPKIVSKPMTFKVE